MPVGYVLNYLPVEIGINLSAVFERGKLMQVVLFAVVVVKTRR